jgi:mannose-6-phosphate isomerase
MSVDGIPRLQCSVQNYAWGKLGSNSSVAQLEAKASKKPIDETKPFAELWMGTHPNGPSRILNSPNKELLRDYNGGKDLPWLLKILSVGTALSIQAHPDPKLAKVLHKKFPQHYKDDNHKPEMAIALTYFEAMCGFRDVQEISSYLNSFPGKNRFVLVQDFELTHFRIQSSGW